MNSAKLDKVCRVCGDKAFAKNFCAITCESCKAFFRRNAENTDKFKCLYGDNCEMNVETRKRCRLCRIRKCFKVGMRKEWILNENEKRERNEKREENRKLRQQKTDNEKPKDQFSDNTVSSVLDNSSDASASNASTTGDNSLEDSLFAFFDDSLIPISSSSSDVLPLSSDNSQEVGTDIIALAFATCGDSLSSYSEDNPTLDQSCTEVVPVSRPITDYSNTFNEIESSRLTELIDASKYLTVTISNINGEITDLSEALGVISRKWDQEIRKIIKTAKTLTSFKNICEDDKVILLKYASVEITFMRSISCYDKLAERWLIGVETDGQDHQTSMVAVDVFKQLSMEKYQSFRIFMNNLADEWDMDEIILHLLFAIVLFNPNRPQLLHKPLVRLQQQVYMHLLKRYLQLRYRSESEAIARFGRFVGIVSDLYDFHELHVRSFLTEEPIKTCPFVSPSPLLRELYDKQA